MHYSLGDLFKLRTQFLAWVEGLDKKINSTGASVWSDDFLRYIGKLEEENEKK